MVITPQFPPGSRGGGPSRTLAAMIGQCKNPGRVRVVTSDTDHGEAAKLPVPSEQWIPWRGASVWYGRTRSVPGLLKTLLAARVGKPQVLYLQSLLDPRFSILPVLLHKLKFWGKATMVIAPRGELDPGALMRKYRKKRFFLVLARRFNLHEDAIWHASTPREAAQIVNYTGSTQRIIVKENETELPLDATVVPRQGTRHRFVYVGRITPSKQLDLLVGALARLADDFELRIVGSAVDANYAEALRHQSDPLGDRVLWLGHLPHAEVMEEFDRASAACFPTSSENFGHVIAEALSRSCPVLICDVTPWTPYIQMGGGIVVADQTEAAWIEALRRILDGPPPHACLDRHDRAARAYAAWRSSRQGMPSILDYMIEGGLNRISYEGPPPDKTPPTE